MVYLIHFSRKLKHARHYLGETGDLNGRMERHRRGDGAKILRAAVKAGISFTVARKWSGRGVNRDFERKLKNTQSKLLCPICSGKGAHQRGRA